MDLKLLESLATALFIGALIGVERTRHQLEEQSGFAGIRTFILYAELGALLGWLSTIWHSMVPFATGFVCLSALLVAAYFVQLRVRSDAAGTTTQTAALVVFILGGVTTMGHAHVAMAVGIATAALLAMKKALHDAVGRISHVELLATLRLLFASFIVLPILPRHAVDPWGALNPHKLWLLVILISALSMVGYVAVRLFGAARGIIIAGIFGGLVSSTAVSLTFARQSQDEPARSRTLAAGTLLAWTVMFARVIVLIAILRWQLLRFVALPLVGLGLVNGAFAGWALLRSARAEGTSGQLSREIALENPFKLLSAIKFALVFALVLLATKLVQRYVPGGGLYWLSALAGSTDVDAIVLSISELAKPNGTMDLLLSRSVIIAACANTVVKFTMTAVLGARALARELVPATGLLIVGSIAALFWMGTLGLR